MKNNAGKQIAQMLYFDDILATIEQIADLATSVAVEREDLLAAVNRLDGIQHLLIQAGVFDREVFTELHVHKEELRREYKNWKVTR